MSKAEIYTKTTCPFCIQAKDLLKANGVEIEEHVFGVSPKALTKDDISKSVGRDINTVPQIVLDEGNGPQYIGGFTDLVKHYSKG